MDFAAALSILKAFSACNLRIYKEFAGFPESGSQENGSGYVIFADSSLEGKGCFNELKDFAKTHNLSITSMGHYLLVSGRGTDLN